MTFLCIFVVKPNRAPFKHNKSIFFDISALSFFIYCFILSTASTLPSLGLEYIIVKNDKNDVQGVTTLDAKLTTSARAIKTRICNPRK